MKKLVHTGHMIQIDYKRIKMTNHSLSYKQNYNSLKNVLTH